MTRGVLISIEHLRLYSELAKTTRIDRFLTVFNSIYKTVQNSSNNTKQYIGSLRRDHSLKTRVKFLQSGLECY